MWGLQVPRPCDSASCLRRDRPPSSAVVRAGACCLTAEGSGVVSPEVAAASAGASHGASSDAEVASHDLAGTGVWRPVAHSALANFVRTFVRGAYLEVLLDDGSSIWPQVSLDYGVTTLRFDFGGSRTSIGLRDVEQVCLPRDFDTMSDVFLVVRPFLNDSCCVLVTHGFGSLACRFESPRLCEYFATCLHLVVANVDRREPSLVEPVVATAGRSAASAEQPLELTEEVAGLPSASSGEPRAAQAEEVRRPWAPSPCASGSARRQLAESVGAAESSAVATPPRGSVATASGTGSAAAEANAAQACGAAAAVAATPPRHLASADAPTLAGPRLGLGRGPATKTTVGPRIAAGTGSRIAGRRGLKDSIPRGLRWCICCGSSIR
mmetsp:Transcript_69052/g.179476  ORF Transcript_69052/g.179476 Transcript_69052/m.179476 type:complete len:381 (+) Transcript_69052:29-1171(+)